MHDRENTTCPDCGGGFKRTGIGTGYGLDREGFRVCYQCCGRRDLEDMKATGKATLYLTDEGITNWPGTLKIQPRYRKVSKYGGGFGAPREDVWFRGPDGADWHGVQRGHYNQLLRCRRLAS